MDRGQAMESLFGAPRALIGVVHLAALPGTPHGGLAVAEIAARAVADARAYHAAGFDALILENMHDRPYLKGSVGPEIVAAMTLAGSEVRRAVPLPLGVQVLAAANTEALAVAHAIGAGFVRVEGFVFAHVADEGVIESSAGALLRYRKAIGAAGVRVFADIKKKHSAHAITADVDLAETARAAEFFGADAVIVTGVATGRETDPADVAAARAAAGIPVLVGSGITAANLARYDAADGLIVGSSAKLDGAWSNPVDEARARALSRNFKSRRSSL